MHLSPSPVSSTRAADTAVLYTHYIHPQSYMAARLYPPAVIYGSTQQPYAAEAIYTQQRPYIAATIYTRSHMWQHTAALRSSSHT